MSLPAPPLTKSPRAVRRVQRVGPTLAVDLVLAGAAFYGVRVLAAPDDIVAGVAVEGRVVTVAAVDDVVTAAFLRLIMSTRFACQCRADRTCRFQPRRAGKCICKMTKSAYARWPIFRSVPPGQVSRNTISHVPEAYR